MKCKIFINTLTVKPVPGKPLDARTQMATSQIWEGELDIVDENEYITKVVIIAEGKEHPICEVPFSPDMGGYWQYIPYITAAEEKEDK